MELILHVGMGKTGSSALQKALRDNSDQLEENGVRYLGMWMQTDPTAPGLGYWEFFDQPQPVWTMRARELAQYCQKTSFVGGPDRFVVSNESIFHHGESFRTFVEAFSEFGDVRCIAYARHPLKWLPSAYMQWGIRHKTRPGKIPTFDEYARGNIHQYQDLLKFQDMVDAPLTVRPYDMVGDVVDDFLSLLGLDIEIPETVFYTGGEPAESVLRALFNNRYDTDVRPQRFDAVLANRLRDGVPRIDGLINESFDFRPSLQIIDENRDLFQAFGERTGVDLLNQEIDPPKEPDRAAIRDRLVDYLVELTIDQSIRMKALEKRLTELESEAGTSDD